MKVATSHSTALVSGASDSVVQSLSQRGLELAIRMMRDTIYTNKPWAVVRETLANAIDEHNKHKVTRPIEITLPTNEDPHLRIRDFGLGLDNAHVMKVFFQYGESLKGADDIGGFGIGAKSPLAYADLFFVTSWHGGEKTLYTSVKSGAMSNAHRMEVVESDEPTGIEVAIPILERDFITFAQYVAAFIGMAQFKNFKVFNGDRYKWEEDEFAINPDRIIWQNDDGIALRDIPYRWPVRNKLMVRDGDILYAVDNVHNYNLPSAFPYCIINVERNSVDLHPSRERIDGTNKSVRTIKAKVESLYADAKKEIEKQINACQSVTDLIKLKSLGSFIGSSGDIDKRFKVFELRSTGIAQISYGNGEISRSRPQPDRWGYHGTTYLTPKDNQMILLNHENIRYDAAIAFARKFKPNATKVLICQGKVENSAPYPPCPMWKEGIDYFVYREELVTDEDRAKVRAEFGRTPDTRPKEIKPPAGCYKAINGVNGEHWHVTPQNILDWIAAGKKLVLIPYLRTSPDHELIDDSQIERLRYNKIIKFDDYVLIAANKTQRAQFKQNKIATMSYGKWLINVVKPQLKEWVDKRTDLIVELDTTGIPSDIKEKFFPSSYIDRIESMVIDYIEKFFSDLLENLPTHSKQAAVNKMKQNLSLESRENRDLIKLACDRNNKKYFPELYKKGMKLLDNLVK